MLRRSLLGKSVFTNTKKIEATLAQQQQFNSYLCESQKVLVMVQACLWSAYYFFLFVSSFVQISKLEGYSKSFWYSLQVQECPLNSNNSSPCSSNTLSSSENTFWVVAYAVTYVIQFLTMMFAAILIRIPQLQLNWNCWGTLLMVLSTCCGPMTMDIIYNSLIARYFMNTWIEMNGTAVIGDVRRSTLDLLIVFSRLSFTSVTGLQMLAFAPRFKAFAIMCLIFGVLKCISDLVLVSVVLNALSVNDLNWTSYIDDFRLSIGSRFFWSILMSYAVPVALAGLIDRMLQSTSARLVNPEN